jgi:FMN-dependent oxidoreductase (nitrilotriacetate monooxygenase family)
VSRRLLFNLFQMNCPSHMTHGTWRHPASRASSYNDLKYWTELAQLCERGMFDAMFFADVAGIYEPWKGSDDFWIENAIQIPISDPIPLVSALSAVTENLGFAVTGSVLQYQPFTWARMASTIDHLSNGRFGWNIVTSFLPNATQNVGYEGLLSHAERYAWADEYLEVCLKLWEASWDDGAVLRDVKRGIYSDPTKVHRIHHKGERYSVMGPHLVEPSPQRTPVLFQAGTSPQGRDFAARQAEGIFTMSQSPQHVATVVDDITKRAQAHGRASDDLHFIQGLAFVVGSTEAEAKALEKDIDEWANPEAEAAMLSSAIGVDLATVDHSMPLKDLVDSLPGLQGTVQRLIDTAPAGSVATVADLARHTGKQWRVVGTPEQIADNLEQWRDAGITGINLISLVMPKTYEDFVDHVTPVLQDRGLMQREYAPGTLREKLFPGRGPRLRAPHPGAGLRNSL